jgi:predicted ATPase
MITKFEVKNFKSLEQLPAEGEPPLEFGPLNVIIGPNGCGKSSLLQAIDFLRAFFQSSVEVYLKEHDWAYQDLPSLRQVKKAIHWNVTVQLDPDEQGRNGGRYSYEASLQPKKYLGVATERLIYLPHDSPDSDDPVELLNRQGRTCTYLDRTSPAPKHTELMNLPASLMSTWDPVDDAKRFPEALHFRKWAERIRSYLIWDPKVLRYPDRGKYNELGSSGEHLASIIGHLREKRHVKFEQLVRRLKRLFPNVSNISVSGKGWGWRTIRLHESNGKEVVFNSQQMSDGVLRLLAITSLLYCDDIPPVVTLEEPENGIHPQLIREVIQVLRELTLRKPPHRCQVFFTTHSPYVLDEFFDHPEQVFCMDRPQPQAGARIRRLGDNRQLKEIQKLFESKSLGEAWVSGLIGATAGVRSVGAIPA